MNKRLKSGLITAGISVGIILGVFATISSPEKVYADSSSVPSTVKVKAAYEGVYQCFVGGAYLASFEASSGGKGMMRTNLTDGIVKLPYGLTDASDNNTNCKQILGGFYDNARSDDELNKGLMDSAIWNGDSEANVVKFFAGTNGDGSDGSMGWRADPHGDVGSGQTAYRLLMKLASGTIDGDVCNTSDGTSLGAGYKYFYTSPGGGGKVDAITFPWVTKDTTRNGLYGHFFGDAAINTTGSNVPLPGTYDNSQKFYFCNDNSYVIIHDGSSTSSIYYQMDIVRTQYYPTYDGIESQTQTINGLVGDWADIVMATSNGYTSTGNTRLFEYTQETTTVEDPGTFDHYTLVWTKPGFMQPVRKLASAASNGYRMYGLNDYSKLALSDSEIFLLYKYYINDVFKHRIVCEVNADFESYSSYPTIKWSPGQTCRINTQASAMPTDKVYGVDSSKHFTKEVTISDIIATMNSLPDADTFLSNANDIPDGGNAGEILAPGETPGADSNTPGTTDPGTNPSANETVPCFEAAKSLGWILCPVISAVGAVTENIYHSVEDSFLQIKPTLYDTSSGTYVGWKNFRNFANILFAIAFVVVILAQLTGIGISNYNIKKLLPRLIMVVLLVNISFVICQLAVDVSNIVGSGLYELLSGLPVGTADGWDFSSALNSIIASLFTAGGIGLLVAGVALTWEYWLIPFLLVLLGCVISILFFFIILGVRQAGVILLIVLAPVAIVCYALPNTKSIFDKWYKLFTALLLVYPICGAMMGGSKFASALLLSNGADNGFIYTLVAMLLSVVPFFFIPTIVRSSMVGLGNLGMRISGLGQRLSGGISRGVRNSEAGRDAQRRLDMRNAEKTVNRLNNRETRLNARGRSLSRHDRRRRAAATARYNRAAYEDIKAGGSQELLTPGSLAYESAMGGQRSRELADQVAGQEALYANNPDMQTIAELEAEHGRLLTELDANPEDMQLEAQMRAVQNVMMKRGDGGKDAIQRSLMNHLGQLQADGRAYDYDATTGRGERTGASVAAAHLSTAHGQTFKNENREMFNLVNDLSERQYRNSHENGGFVETAPGSGQFASQYYRGRGANGWKAETLAGSTAGTQANILHGIRSGAISGQSLRNLATTARSALRDERLASTMNDETVANLRSIVAADAATDAQTWDDSAPYRPTAGSTVVSGMDAETLHDMADHIESLDMTQADSQVQAQQIAENVYRAMMNPDVSYDPAKMQAMQGVLAAANRQGVQRMMTGTGPGVRFSEVDPATLRLVHTRPMAMPPAPEGYDEHGAWTGTLGTETDDHRTAREEWQRETARRRMYNQENGFNPDGSRPTPPPPPPPPGGP